MKVRHVDKRQVIEAVSNPEMLFEDTESNVLVALRRIQDKNLLVVFALIDGTARIVTVYYASDVDSLIKRKLQRGAWLKKS